MYIVNFINLFHYVYGFCAMLGKVLPLEKKFLLALLWFYLFNV